RSRAVGGGGSCDLRPHGGGGECGRGRQRGLVPDGGPYLAPARHRRIPLVPQDACLFAGEIRRLGIADPAGRGRPRAVRAAQEPVLAANARRARATIWPQAIAARAPAISSLTSARRSRTARL